MPKRYSNGLSLNLVYKYLMYFVNILLRNGARRFISESDFCFSLPELSLPSFTVGSD